MPSSVSFGLVTISNLVDTNNPTTANQWVFTLSGGAVTRSQYQDDLFVVDDGGPLPVPSGFDISDLESSVAFIFKDDNNFVGPGSICLANPSGGGGNLAVFDFAGGEVYTYAAPAGWLASAATWTGAHLLWAEASTIVVSGAFAIRVRRSDGMFSTVTTLGTHNFIPLAVSAPDRPISPRYTDKWFFFCARWDTTNYQDHAFHLLSRDFNTHSQSTTPDRSFLQRDTIGYKKNDGGSIYGARSTYAIGSFPLMQGAWIQGSSATELPLPVWPDFIANPDWGNGVELRFANAGTNDGVFQCYFTDHTVIRGSAAGETEPTPIKKFTPDVHPILLVPPEIVAYARPYPDAFALPHICPLRLSITESVSLTRRLALSDTI